MAPSPTPGCSDLITNGGFETDGAWYIPDTAYPADYSTERGHGQRSMRLGIPSGENVLSYSTVWQTIHVPTHADDPVLTFWYYPVSADTEHDLQYALILDEHGVMLDWALYVRSDAQSWTFREYSLSGYKGQSIRISFGVYNDGGGGITSMYVDDVSVVVCGVQPTPSARIFLPVILRPFGEEDVQHRPTAPSLPLVTDSALDVYRLWVAPESVDAPDFVRSVAFNTTNDLLYWAADEDVWVLNMRTRTVIARIPLGTVPRGLDVDVAANRIYAALWEADALAVIDGARHTLWKMVSGIPGASGVAVGDDCIYVTATRSDDLVLVDRQNCAIIERLPVGDAPYAVTYDRGRQRVYVGNAGDDTVSIVDAGTVALVNTVRLGGLGHPQDLALDPVRDRLYVTYALSPKYGAIAAIDASSGQVISRLVGDGERPLFGAYGIAVDPLKGWVYVATTDEMLVLAGETLRVAQVISGVGPVYAFGLHVDPIQGRLYVADGRHGSLSVLE